MTSEYETPRVVIKMTRGDAMPTREEQYAGDNTYSDDIARLTRTTTSCKHLNEVD